MPSQNHLPELGVDSVRYLMDKKCANYYCINVHTDIIFPFFPN